MRRIGILGGTFDPVHTGHVVVAATVRAVAQLDELLVVVAADPWQKAGRVVAAATERLGLAMVAFDGIEGVTVSAIEIERGGPTYTADTLTELAAPDTSLHLVVGSDVVTGLDTWVRADELRRLASLIVVTRSGDERADPPGEGWTVERVDIPRLDISSTDIRARLAAGLPIDGLVPPAVIQRIRERRLYDSSR